MTCLKTSFPPIFAALLLVHSVQLNADVLIWNNQDQLKGELVDLSDGSLRWKTPLFQKPMALNVEFLSHLNLETKKTDAVTDEPFRLETHNGDVVFGDLKSIGEDTVEMQSKRFGSFSLKKGSIRELRQLSLNKAVYDGPRWLDDWRVLKVGRDLTEWSATDMGYLQTQKYGGEIYHDLPRLEHAEINVALSWKGKPGFQLDLSPASDLLKVRGKARLSIKSWGNEVVAQSSAGASRYISLFKMSAEQREIRLRLIWDNKAGQVTILSSTGKELSKLTIDGLGEKQAFGVLFKNRSDDLTVEQIRLSSWNGVTKSESRTPGEPYVRLADGSLVADAIDSMEADTTVVRTVDGKEVALSDIAIAEFNTTPSGNSFQPARVRFADGSMLTGDVLELTTKEIAIKSDFLREPIRGSNEGLASLRFFHGRTHEYDFEFYSNGERLSGNLKPTKGDSQLGWASVGATNAVSSSDGISFVIERRLKDDGKQAPKHAGEVVYLKDRSIIFGDVSGIANNRISLASLYTGEVSIPTNELQAIEMIHGSGRCSFTDADWEYLHETKPEQRAPDHLAVAKTVSMQNKKLIHGGKLTFTCSWEEDFVGLLTIQLGDSGKHITRCSFSKDGLSARCLVNAAQAVSLPSFPDRRAIVSIEAEDQRISVWVNGILASSAPTGRKVSKEGIWIQCGSARHRRTNGTNGNASPRLTISRLRVGESASRLGAGFAAADELEMMLKLPRNKRQNPPTHILCATNRDLLRGKLVGLDASNLSFASGYDEISLPRDNVAAVVWLKKPDSKRNASPESGTPEILLRDGSVFRGRDIRMAESSLTCKHVTLGKVSIPLVELWKIERSRDKQKAGNYLADWKLSLTKEPDLVSDTEQGIDSPLIDQDVSDLEIRMLNSDPIEIGQFTDQIVVLDFWASWCAPCVKSLPRLRAVIGEFPKDKVKLVAINQGEAPFTIETFLAHQDLELEVGIDENGDIAKRFDVRSIPQTIVIGPKGKVARVFVGAPASLYGGVSEAIKGLITPTD